MITAATHRWPTIRYCTPFVPFFLSLSFFIVTPPARGYTGSPYTAYPIEFWVLAGLTVTTALACCIHSMSWRQDNRTFLIPFSALVATNAIILALPLQQGYFLASRSDSLTHLGFARDILTSGRLGASNFYPAMHIQVSVVTLIDNIGLNISGTLLNVLMQVVFNFGIFALANSRAPSQKVAKQAALLGTPFLFATYQVNFTPFTWSVFLLPLVLLVLLKCQRRPSSEMTGAAILLMLVYPFLHPLSTFFLVIVFLVFGLAGAHAVLSKHKLARSPPHVATLSMILIATFTIWYSSFVVWGQNIRHIYLVLQGELAGAPLGTYQTVVTTKLSLSEAAQLALASYGPALVYAFVGMVLLVRAKSHPSKLPKAPDPSTTKDLFGICFIVFAALFFPFLVLNLFISGNPFREFTWALVFAVLLVGFRLPTGARKAEITDRRSQESEDARRQIPSIVLAALVLCPFLLGMANVYTSQTVGVPNSMTTYSDLDSGRWLYGYSASGSAIYTPDELFTRLPDYLYGYEYAHLGHWRFVSVPPHFGPSSNPTGSSLQSGAYVVLTDYTEFYYDVLWPGRGSFSSTDFQRLSVDPQFDSVYQGGDVTIYYVNP